MRTLRWRWDSAMPQISAAHSVAGPTNRPARSEASRSSYRRAHVNPGPQSKAAAFTKPSIECPSSNNRWARRLELYVGCTAGYVPASKWLATGTPYQTSVLLLDGFTDERGLSRLKAT